MNVIKPTPSSAAVAMQKYFASRGAHLTLSVVQEGLARAEGYNSWNALVADQPPRGTKSQVAQAVLESAEYANSEGLKLWAITGRVAGDDDDSLYVIWAPAYDDAAEDCRLQLWLDDGGSEETFATRNDDLDQIYIINQELVGSIQEGRFVFEKGYVPAV